MKSDLANYLNLTKEKKDAVKKLLDYSKSKQFKPEIEYVEEFQQYFIKRDTFFEEIENLDKKLKKINIDNCDKKNSLYKEAERIEEETKKLILQVIELDKDNRQVMDCIMDLLKGNLKEVRTQKKVTKGYSLYVDYSGSKFDSRQ